jgi:hypothetical protein
MLWPHAIPLSDVELRHASLPDWSSSAISGEGLPSSSATVTARRSGGIAAGSSGSPMRPELARVLSLDPPF